jgi:Trk K+ transport system NAD-binding subunit
MHIVAVERQGVGRMLADLDVIEEGDLLFVSVVRESLHELTDLLSREQGA